MKAPIKINIELKDMEVVKDLIELLEAKFDDLPKEIQEKIEQIEAFGLHDLGRGDYERIYGAYDEYKSSIDEPNIIKINKVLKRVIYITSDEKNITEHIIYPEHFWHSFDGKKVIEW